MNNTIPITFSQLKDLLHLDSAILDGALIPQSLADTICDYDSEMTYFVVEESSGLYRLWLKKHWLNHSVIVEEKKRNEEVQRRKWNIASECIRDLKEAIEKKFHMSSELAERFAREIVLKKKLETAKLMGIDLTTKYKEIVS